LASSFRAGHARHGSASSTTVSEGQASHAHIDRTTARSVGWLFIGTFVFSIPGYLLYGPVLDRPGYILGSGHDRSRSARSWRS